MERKITFRLIDRSNWREALKLTLRDEQREFVQLTVMTLASVFIQPYGGNYVQPPMGVYDGDLMVGYVNTIIDSDTADDYWIDNIVISQEHQGKGYGRATMLAAIGQILAQYPRCDKIQLSCHRLNSVAAALYLSLGFTRTERVDFKGEPIYELAGESLARYRLAT